MEIIRALKMRIYPNEEQALKIDKTIGSCRFVYNHMLARNKKVYARRNEHLSYYDMQNLLPHMKEYLPWLKESDSQALKYACRQVNKAFDGFFKKRTHFPRFHSKRTSRQSYTTTNKAYIDYISDERKVKLPFLGWMCCSDNRILKGYDFKQATVSKKNGKYYVSITYVVEKDIASVPVSENQALGLDYKSDGLYVDSESNAPDMPHWFRLAQSKLKKEQRKLRNKVGTQKGETKSHGYFKQLQKVQNLHEHIANQRLDYLHKLSTRLADMYDVILIEDLNMKAIANKGFGNGKATLDNGWGMFTTMLNYKMAERGKHLQKIDRWYPSSQTCSVCGCVNEDLKNLSIRKWTCPHCETSHDRDINAAINIKQEGLRLLGIV
nr:MAG TPA: endonuclease [Caudoviricetes sp.]